MSWKLRSTPPTVPRQNGFDIQTNAPAYQNALLQDVDRFLSPTAVTLTQDLPEFETPRSSRKKAKSTSHHQHLDKSGGRQENVPPHGSADTSVPSTEMATPRESQAKPKSVEKVKVADAMPAALSVSGTRVVMPLGMSSLLESAGTHSGRPHSEHLPTAHVFPSPCPRPTVPTISHTAAPSRSSDHDRPYSAWTEPALQHHNATEPQRPVSDSCYHLIGTGYQEAAPSHWEKEPFSDLNHETDVTDLPQYRNSLPSHSDRFLNPPYMGEVNRMYGTEGTYNSHAGVYSNVTTTHRQQAPPVDASTVVSRASVVSDGQAGWVNQTGGVHGGTYPYRQTGSLERHAYTHTCSGFTPPLAYMPDTGRYTRPVMPSGVTSTSVVSPDGFVSDLTRWQQQHQQHLRRQQLEVAKPLYTETGLPSAAVTGQSAGLSLLADPHRLDTIKAAADNIIREKDAIIEQQKMKMTLLERQSRDARLLKAKNVSEETNSYSMIHQEASCGSARHVQTLGSKSTEELQKKLGQCEYEIQELKAKLDKDTAAQKQRLSQLEDKLRASEREAKDWKEKYLSSSESQDSLQKKFDGLERYLGDLPTSAENGKRSTETVKEERSRYKQRVADLDRRLSELNNGIMSRDNLIQSLEDSYHKLNARLEEKERDVAKLRKETEVYRRDSRLPSFLFDDESQDLQQELAVLRADYDKAKKVTEGLQRRLVQGEGKHRSMARDLEEKLTHEQEAVAALKGELATKDTHLKKLRHSIKQLGAENEDLLEKQIATIERVQELEQQLSGDLRLLEQRLLTDLGTTFSELQALVQICMERADGHDPNISILLGVKTLSASSLETQPQSTDSSDLAQSLRFKLSRIFQLRQDIDHLRELICNKYAEDMSENLNCTTQ